MKTCKLWKITLQHTDLDDDLPFVFWAYHLDEKLARSAALNWGCEQKPSGNVSIQKVDLIK